MNTKVDRHYPDGSWEEYALGMLSDEDCKLLEEHLLICSACQDLLAEVDEYIRVVKTALATREPSEEPSLVTDFAE